MSSKRTGLELRSGSEAYPFPAIVMSPTAFSGFESILAWKMVFAASACASNRDGW